jgi:hypothetical protein
MPSRLAARLRRLEAQAMRSDLAHGYGLSSLLGVSCSKEEDTVPLASLPDAELDAKITALTGTRGLSLLLKETLEEERTRRWVAQGSSPQHEPHPCPPLGPAGTAGPCPRSPYVG